MPKNLTYDHLVKIECFLPELLLVWARGTHDIVTESLVIALVYRVIHSVFCVTEIA